MLKQRIAVLQLILRPVESGRDLEGTKLQEEEGSNDLSDLYIQTRAFSLLDILEVTQKIA